MRILDPRTAWTITTLAAAAAASSTLALAPTTTAAALAACLRLGLTAATGALITWTTRVDSAPPPW